MPVHLAIHRFARVLLLVPSLLLLSCEDSAERVEGTSTARLSSVSADDAGNVRAGGIDFNRDIRPILSDRCFACHGPDAAVADDAGGFRLDRFETATVPAASGAMPIVPGDAAASELMRRLTSDHPRVVMPPPSSNLSVTEDEVELLRRWIDEGAAYQRHWAYEPAVRPELPDVVNSDWTRGSIDRFVAARLEQAGLSPSDEAERATLIRRLSLDLTGLPPTLEEIGAFVSDTSPDAYERLVDRLLASPHFGERLALIWLDAARYADTNGFHHDNVRTAWPWRQWVIEAFNQNMPYDQFVIEQLAGDLLPNATVDQVLASAFCRMHNINDEGGALDEEYRVEAIADRIETIATVFMAQTYTCARCHDHKYDPITQDDYFSTWAYFNSVEERGVYPNNKTEARAYPARMLYREAADRERHAALTAERRRFAAERDAQAEQAQEWQQALLTEGAVDWADPEFVEGKGKSTVLTEQPDGSLLASGPNPNKETIEIRLRTDRQDLRVLRLDALRDPSMPESGLGRAPNGNAVLTQFHVRAVSIANPERSKRLNLVFAHADHAQTNGDYDIHNALRADAKGWAVGSYNHAGDRRVTFITAEPFGFAGGTELIVTLDYQSEYPKHTLGRVRLDAGAPIADQLPDYPERYFASMKRDTELARAINALDRRAVPVVIMKELDKPRTAYVLDRGAYDGALMDRPRERRPPVFMGVAMPADAPDNRLGFARWLVEPDHPLTARVHVNRLWQMLFGTGIVATVEDFGSQAEWPSHPALLDYLAVEFVASGWDQKALIKQIVTSATYRQRATAQSAAFAIDPGNRLLSSFPRRRLPGEIIRDQALFVSGLLNDQIGGPSVKPYQPKGLWNEVSIGGSSNTQHFKRDDGEALYRRSMYTFWKRTSPPPQMAAFNAPTREFCVVNRGITNTPMQTLVIWNDEQFLEAARVLAQRTLAESDSDNNGLARIYQRCTGAAPDERVLAILRDTLDHFRKRYADASGDAEALLSQGDAPLPDAYDPAELAAWMMIGSTVLSLDETIVRD